jgi:hypothetical protein
LITATACLGVDHPAIGTHHFGPHSDAALVFNRLCGSLDLEGQSRNQTSSKQSKGVFEQRDHPAIPWFEIAAYLQKPQLEVN